MAAFPRGAWERSDPPVEADKCNEAAIFSSLGTNLAKQTAQVTNGGCPTYDKDVAHPVRPSANQVAAFLRFGPTERGRWCGREALHLLCMTPFETLFSRGAR